MKATCKTLSYLIFATVCLIATGAQASQETKDSKALHQEGVALINRLEQLKDFKYGADTDPAVAAKLLEQVKAYATRGGDLTITIEKEKTRPDVPSYYDTLLSTALFANQQNILAWLFSEETGYAGKKMIDLPCRFHSLMGSPILIAAWRGDLAAFNLLLKHGASIAPHQLRGIFRGTTILMAAVHSEKVAMVQRVLDVLQERKELEATINAQMPHGLTVLDLFHNSTLNAQAFIMYGKTIIRQDIDMIGHLLTKHGAKTGDALETAAEHKDSKDVKEHKAVAQQEAETDAQKETRQFFGGKMPADFCRIL